MTGISNGIQGVTTRQPVPERITWAVELMAPGPDDQLLEIGCGPGVAVGAISEKLRGGAIVAIDRSATAIDRAQKRNAHHVSSGRAAFVTMTLEDVRPTDVLRGGRRFDKILAMNVNLFWVGSATKELDLIKRLLKADDSLYLFFGYGPGLAKRPRRTHRAPDPRRLRPDRRRADGEPLHPP